MATKHGLTRHLTPCTAPDVQVRQAVSEYAAVATKHGLTPSELALAWCHSRWFVASTIIGATSLAQLKENIGAFDKVQQPSMHPHSNHSRQSLLSHSLPYLTVRC